MQIYRTYSGTRYFVIDGVVLMVKGGVVFKSNLVVDDIINAISYGTLLFVAIAEPWRYMQMKDHAIAMGFIRKSTNC